MLTVLQAPTVTGTGTQLDQIFIPKTASANVRGFATKSESIEWVLAQDATYLLRLANTGTTTSVVASLRPFWYEESAAYTPQPLEIEL